jgi:hypothetical protein
MALSIEFGIATTYALGVGFYVVCAGIIVGSRQAIRFGVSAAARAGGLQLAGEDGIASVAASDAPSIQSAEIETVADNRALEPSVPPAAHARAGEFGR